MTAISAKHPFQIESVMDNVFQYLHLRDIIRQRSVCKVWHKIGTKRLIDRIDEVQITFGSNCSWLVPSPHKTIENFLQLQENFSFKFTNFASYFFDGDLNGKIPNSEQTMKLFNQHGIHMKHVKLDLSGNNCWRLLSDVLLTLAPNVEVLHLRGYPHPQSKIVEKHIFPEKKPQLKLKSIILHSLDEFEDPIFGREFLTDLFQSSWQLESLSVDLEREQVSCDRIGHERLVLNTLAKRGNISNLKELSLGEINDEVFSVLATYFKRAPLKEFDAKITLIDSSETLQQIAIFLDDHKITWTKLCFTLPCVEEWMDGIDFPTMINLTCLSITEWCMDETELVEDEAPFGIFNFGRQFPNLVTLKLEEDPKTNGRSFFKLEEWFPEETTPVLSLKELTLPPQFHAYILRRIGRIFPNVEKLELTVQTVVVLKELWVTWPEMKILDIAIIPGIPFGSTSLDSIFTGIPDASLKTLKNCSTTPVALKSFPFIGRLKELTHLLIKGPSRSGLYKVNQSFNTGLKLTDATARLALSNLKELVFLRISGDRHEISPSCVQNLCNGLGLHQYEDGNALRLAKYEWQKKIRIFDW